jgi:hypothetical protein
MHKRSEIYFTPSVKWLEPFIESVSSLIPLERLKRVIGYKVRARLSTTQQAQIIKHLPNGIIVITLRIAKWNHTTNKHEKECIGTILEALAHELSHVLFWEHTPEHFELQSKIQIKFAKVLKKQGITDTGIPYKEKKNGSQKNPRTRS